MAIPTWAWFVTIGAFLAVIAFDFYLVARNPRDPSIRESTIWVSVYVALAVLFGLGVFAVAGPQYGGEFFAGWITEYSLSVDNLFIFVLIMSRFAVPREYRQKVLLIGIVLALILRGIFIALGAEAISRFDWMFYLFGAFLIYTAWKLIQSGDEEEEFKENRALKLVRRVLPSTEQYNGAALTVQDRRQAAGHPDAHRDGGDREHRPAVRARLDPGDLRAHPGAVSRLHRQRLRAHGAAAAVLPHRRAAGPPGVPRARASRSSSPSSG